MRLLPEPPDLLNKVTVSLWLVVCLSMLPMTVPVFAAISSGQSATMIEPSGFTLDEGDTPARPLKAEVVDNRVISPSESGASGASGGFVSSAPDVALPLLSVLYIAYLRWRFTLRHRVR